MKATLKEQQATMGSDIEEIVRLRLATLGSTSMEDFTKQCLKQ